MENYTLTIDCGTQSLRAIIFDKQGQILASSKKNFKPYDSEQPGWAEQNPNLYWAKLCEATIEIKKQAPQIVEAVTSMVVTTQRDTCVLLDKKGNVLRPAIIWADQRKLNHRRKFTTKAELALKATGMNKIAHILSDQCPAHWIQDHQPEIWAKTYKYLLLSGYLTYKLTGEFVDVVANQIGHIPFNYKGFEWEKKHAIKRSIFQIEDDKLVDLKFTGEKLGGMTEIAAKQTGLKQGLSVIAGGSDKGCETLGVGCNDDTVVAISLGSQASIQTTTDKYYELIPFIPPFPAVIPNKYNPEIQVYRGYWMVTWFKEEFAYKEVLEANKRDVFPEVVINEALNTVPPGSDGLVLLPYWGAGLKNPEAKGAILGFTDIHTREHIYRAIIEGLNFALVDGLKRIEKKSGKRVEKIMISGGGSVSDTICQITADMFNLPVCRIQTYENSSLGAAMVGYVANGTYADYDEAIKGMVHIKDTFEPNKEVAKTYEQLYSQIHKDAYQHVKPLYKKLYNMGI
jgi:sugar (pentulose or hexulose) kinase